MPFALDRYAHSRPVLYHLTARENLDHIRSRRRLESSALLLAAAGRGGGVRTKRREMMAVAIGGHRVLLRDQAPLHEGNIGFAPGWTFEDVLADLNRRVFFWPGRAYGPISYWLRYIQRYLDQRPVVLRASFDTLVRDNRGRGPLFCPYNSGSPRYSGGRPSSRGPDLFLPAERFPGPPGRVVEVTFLDYVVLPADTEYRTLSDSDDVTAHLAGPWQRLFPRN